MCFVSSNVVLLPAFAPRIAIYLAPQVHIDGLHRTVVGRERKLSDKPSVPPVSFAEALILRSCLIARVQSILSQHQKVGGKVVKSSQLSVTKVGWNSMCFSAARRCYAALVG